ncbi:putative membrane protein [Rhodopirellula maiorica SM1]|uniref:Putative membrane protein n=1 Tax=Rhodopirellula maiorica SM1 TaxID=1265738 RepID=M5RMV6_9BACT|nr:hypothetical protein [Rhodopirellula maiorica]EMI15284.1 putative membrane protein [Rhodopirellula maiorica SM1]
MNCKRIWIVHLSLLVTAAVWAVTDPKFETTIQYALSAPSVLASHVGWARAAAFLSASLVAITSLAAMFAAMLLRRASNVRSRSLQSLLAMTAVVAGWCALGIHHDAIAWQGKRIRFACRVDELESIVAPLRTDWPTNDGDLSTIGPYMAYPFGRPTTLVLLHSPRLASEAVYVSAVERGSGGSIKLQLTGSDGGDWAEWHPPHSHPRSFVGGLADPHELQAVCSIGSGWYLVRYDVS